MKTFKVWTNTGLDFDETFEVSDDVTEAEIEEIARDVAFNITY
jgi:hypothetical protein